MRIPKRMGVAAVDRLKRASRGSSNASLRLWEGSRLAASGLAIAVWAGLALAGVGVLLSPARAAAQSSQPEALEAVKAAVASELQNSLSDKSIWMYRDKDFTPGNNAVYNAVETRQGELRRMIELNGQPLTPEQDQAEQRRIRQFVSNAAEQSHQRKNSAHDDNQATELLKMLPMAFIWTVESQTPELMTLNFKPNPNFSPPDVQSRVMGQMGGQLVIAKDGDRIRTLKGRLTTDIVFGLSIFGKLDRGGTFDVERRIVGNGRWQITETHVHITGHALFFKTIGSQEDEVKTEWKPSTADTLAQAAHLLGVD